jgi:Xaa-Pro dipeptidase
MERIKLLQQSLITHDESQLLIYDDSTISYILQTPFSTGERFIGLLVSQQHDPILLCNHLFSIPPLLNTQVVLWADDENPLTILEPMLQMKVGVDKSIPSRFLLPLQNFNCNREFYLSELPDRLRAIKSPDEIDKMRRASAVNDQIMKELLEIIDGTQTEREIANLILSIQKNHRVSPSFDPIVAFGDHASDPQAIPTNRIVQIGEPILIDMGCRLDGYCSDMTRTFFFEQCLSPDLYYCVKTANENAIAAVHPGASFSSIDYAARSVFKEAGLANAFLHRTGHGIGLSVHEPYDVSATNLQSIEVGMCFSIEPGLYFPNEVGIRIEDLVAVTPEGVEVLNHFTKDLIIIKKKNG